MLFQNGELPKRDGPILLLKNLNMVSLSGRSLSRARLKLGRWATRGKTSKRGSREAANARPAVYRYLRGGGTRSHF